jgi:hypothetical protein
LVGRNFFVAREIEVNQHKVFLSFESRRIKNFFIKLDAPATPVAAGKVDEDIFLLSGCLFLGSVEISEPTLGGKNSDGG